MDKRKILLIMAGVLGLAGLLLAVVYVNGADDRAASKFENVPVLVATAVIEPGEELAAASAAGKIVTMEIPKTQVLSTAQSKLEAIDGTVALTRVYPGEQILAEKFGAAGAVTTSALQIAKGEMAISVNLTDTARVAGFVSPGSKVAVFYHGVDPRTQVPFTRQLLAPVTVIGVGSTTLVPTTTTAADGAQTTEQLPRTLLTLSLGKRNAQKVLYASAQGDLSFALVNADTAFPDSPATNAENLFNGASVIEGNLPPKQSGR